MHLAIQNVYPEVIKNVKFNIFLLIYIPMNTINNYSTIHLELNKIIVLEVTTLLMTYLIKYVLQIKLKIEIYIFLI